MGDINKSRAREDVGASTGADMEVKIAEGRGNVQLAAEGEDVEGA